MSIYNFTLPVQPYSKPRGKVSKTGHIYHNTKEYVTWKKNVKAAILSSGGLTLPKHFSHVCFIFHYKPKSGHPPDGDNLQGGIQDALVEHGFLTDDNINVIRKWYGSVILDSYEYIDMYFCSNFNEFLHVLKITEQ